MIADKLFTNGECKIYHRNQTQEQAAANAAYFVYQRSASVRYMANKNSIQLRVRVLTSTLGRIYNVYKGGQKNARKIEFTENSNMSLLQKRIREGISHTKVLQR